MPVEIPGARGKAATIVDQDEEQKNVYDCGFLLKSYVFSLISTNCVISSQYSNQRTEL